MHYIRRYLQKWTPWLALAIAVPAVSSVGYHYVIYARRILKQEFAEKHAFLAGEEGDMPFGDGKLSDEEIVARDNETKLISTPEGIVSWNILAKAHFKKTSGSDIPQPEFTKDIEALDKQSVIAKGYMFPLDQIGKQSHFLLSPLPPSCPFCLPAGPNELIEVTPNDPIEFSYDVITVKGRLELLKSGEDIKEGMFYRLRDAEGAE